MNEISTTEQVRFESLEAAIDNARQVGRSSALTIARALQEIRDSRLYRRTHDDFNSYCNERWKITRREADQHISLLQAADDAGLKWVTSERNSLKSPAGAIKNEGESTLERAIASVASPEPAAIEVKSSHLAELAKAPREQRKAIMAKAAAAAPKGDDGRPKVTAALVKRAVEVAAAADPDAPPWANFEEEMRMVMVEARKLKLHLDKALRADSSTKSIRERWAYYYTWQSTIGGINAFIRMLEDNLPAVLNRKAPGFRPARSVILSSQDPDDLTLEQHRRMQSQAKRSA